MAFGDADRDVFLEAAVFGVAVVYGATTTTGIYDESWEETLDGQVVQGQGTMKGVEVKTGAFTPVLGGSISVGGTNYTVRKIQGLPPDSRMTVLLLRDV